MSSEEESVLGGKNLINYVDSYSIDYDGDTMVVDVNYDLYEFSDDDVSKFAGEMDGSIGNVLPNINKMAPSDISLDAKVDVDGSIVTNTQIMEGLDNIDNDNVYTSMIAPILFLHSIATPHDPEASRNLFFGIYRSIDERLEKEDEE